MAGNAAVQRAAARPRSAFRWVPSLYGVACLAIMGAVLVIALSPRLDPDIWWHLRVGEYIITRHSVPSTDFLSYSAAGHPWTDHEWLAEALMYACYRLAGLWGPIVLFAAVITTTFVLVYRRLLLLGLHRVLATFVVAAAFVTSSASWGPRVQMVTLCFLAAYLLILQRFDETRDRRLLIALPALMLVWANMHGGFVLGLAVLALTLAGEYLNRRTGRPGAWSMDDLRALAFALLATLAVTIVNPHGYHLLLYPLTFILPNAYTNLIEESASPNFHLPVMMLFEALILLLIAAGLIGRPRVNWTHLLLIAAFTHLALSQVRNVAVWAVVVAPLVGYYLQQAAPTLRDLFPGRRYRRRPVSGSLSPVLNLTFLLLVGLVYVVEAAQFDTNRALRQAETSTYPRGAIAYMRAHRLPPKVFVSYSWGGYLLWNLSPRYKDFMDSRADTLFDDRTLSTYLAAYTAQPSWKSALRRTGAQDVLIEPSAPLAQVLRLDPAWHLRYHDRVSDLFARAQSPTA